MPEVICFDRNNAETLASIDAIRARLHQLKRPTKRLRLSRIMNPKVAFQRFEDIKFISPAAAMVIAAEYDRIYEHS